MGALASALMQKGYNATDAANEEKGPRAAELAREYLGQGQTSSQSYSSPTTASGVSSFDDIIRKTQELLTQSQAPAIASLQASKPEIAAGFAAQKEYLGTQQTQMQQRYQNLLNDIKTKETAATNTATKTTAGELGQRGIAPNSTFYQQQITGAQQPIADTYAGLTRDTALSQAQEASALTNQYNQLGINETSQYRDLANAIANIQSATGQSSVSTALSMYQQQQQAQQELQKQQMAASQPQTLSEGQTLYDPSTGKAIYTAPKTYKAETDPADTIKKVLAELGIDVGGNSGNNNSNPPSYFVPYDLNSLG